MEQRIKDVKQRRETMKLQKEQIANQIKTNIKDEIAKINKELPPSLYDKIGNDLVEKVKVEKAKLEEKLEEMKENDT